MIKSKHFRKDVILARVFFLVLCALVIAGIVWGISLLTGSSEKPPVDTSESSSSELQEGSESESESGLVNENESGSESESESGTEPDSQQPTEEPTKLYAKVISKNNLNLRKAPNTTSEVLASLASGTKLEVIEELDGWFKVSYEDYVGYVSSSYVKLLEE